LIFLGVFLRWLSFPYGFGAFVVVLAFSAVLRFAVASGLAVGVVHCSFVRFSCVCLGSRCYCFGLGVSPFKVWVAQVGWFSQFFGDHL